MTGTSVKDPLAESYISVVHRLLDELTKVADLTTENAELKAEIAKRDAYGVTVAEIVKAARITDGDLEAEALAEGLPAFPVPFPNRFPIWDKWSDVPDGVVYESIDEQSISRWINTRGSRRVLDPFLELTHASKNSNQQMADLAPFVEVV